MFFVHNRLPLRCLVKLFLGFLGMFFRANPILFPTESQFVKVAMAAQNAKVAGPVSANLSIIFDLCGYV